MSNKPSTDMPVSLTVVCVGSRGRGEGGCSACRWSVNECNTLGARERSMQHATCNVQHASDMALQTDLRCFPTSCFPAASCFPASLARSYFLPSFVPSLSYCLSHTRTFSLPHAAHTHAHARAHLALNNKLVIVKTARFKNEIEK